eukprot:8679902-Karenia_brevis.AAC.1
MFVNNETQNAEKSMENTLPQSQKATITVEKESWPFISDRWKMEIRGAHQSKTFPGNGRA